MHVYHTCSLFVHEEYANTAPCTNANLRCTYQYVSSIYLYVYLIRKYLGKCLLLGNNTLTKMALAFEHLNKTYYGI